jgi:[ribosomal protein S18]-alanine N-acetyltransferase
VEIRILSRALVREHLERLLEMDRETPGERWAEPQFLLDLPGKWECSRLALVSSEVVGGFAIASFKENGIHIHRLVVAAGFRGRGLGRALLKSVAADAAAREVSTLTLKVGLSNEEARRFYENLGFEESGRDLRNVALTVRVSALLATGQAR